MSGDLIGVSDEPPQILFLGKSVVEPQSLIPDLVEKTASGGGGDELGVLVTVDGLFAVVGIGDTDRIVDLDESLAHGKEHFKVIPVEFGLNFVVAVPHPGQVVGTECNVVSGRSNRFAIGR